MSREDILARIAIVADALGDELKSVVFVGGAVASLYDGHVDIRPTADVDCATQVTRLGYAELAERLRKRGFRHVTDRDAPSCRFELANGIPVDVMPDNPAILGFTNRWYAQAISYAAIYRLPGGKEVKAITPLYFLATKFEAFRGRGNRNYGMSHNLEDIVALLVARPELLNEIADAADDVTQSLLVDIGSLAGIGDFLDTVPFYFPREAALPDSGRQGPLRNVCWPCGASLKNEGTFDEQ